MGQSANSSICPVCTRLAATFESALQAYNKRFLQLLSEKSLEDATGLMKEELARCIAAREALHQHQSSQHAAPHQAAS